jgi:hypothetical protein
MNKKAFYFSIIGFILIVLSGFSSAAQNITGIWRGYFFTETNDQYKFEIQIKQNTQKSVTGVSYSYLTTVFYGKATMTGYFNTAAKTALIQEIKTVELKMSQGSVACIMKLLMNYTKSGNEEFLEGTYTSKYELADKRVGIKKGEGCGSGKVYLRKVVTSDFYVEPFLRNHPSVKKPDIATTKPPENKTPSTTKPVTKQPVKTTPQKTTTKPPVKKDVATKPKQDTARKMSPPVTRQEPIKSEMPKPSMEIPALTRSRENDLVQTIIVNQRDINIRLYDNGEVDDDSISIYMDNKLILANQRLSAAPITINLKMDVDNAEHTLVMVAENMGRFPPNTSLMIVQDGDKKYEVRITSTERKNAMVRFKLENKTQ